MNLFRKLFGKKKTDAEKLKEAEIEKLQTIR